MAEVLLFHHAQGLTAGCLAFAGELRAAGHVVATPDLYDGRTFDSFAEGVAHAEQLGFRTILDRGRTAAEGLPPDLVYVGISLGVMPAQLLAQTRPGARGAVLISAAVPTSAFEGGWPPDVPLQLHTMADDEWGDVDVAHALARDIETAELFLYRGDRHLFVDSSLPDHDADAAGELTRRVIGFLDALG